MCKVYNTIGSLSAIKKHLQQNYVEGFNSVQELLSFQKSYPTAREQIVANQRTLITAETENLSTAIVALEQEILNEKTELNLKFKSDIERLEEQIDQLANAQKNLIQEFTYSFKALFILFRITYVKLFTNTFISRSIKPKVDLLNTRKDRYSYLTSHFEEAITQGGGIALAELDRKKRVIDEINLYIYGALGEQKVVDELKRLPDQYTLINDFCYTFNRTLYYKNQKTHIRTIQIDHVLVSPAGVFMIETKNWSKESVQSLNLRSPVAQIQRTNFALFILLNRQADFKLDPHHWGERKIPIRNLIVLINHKPDKEFEYVKVLTLNELLGYVEYFTPVLSNTETQEIAEYLVRLKQ